MNTLIIFFVRYRVRVLVCLIKMKEARPTLPAAILTPTVLLPMPSQTAFSQVGILLNPHALPLWELLIRTIGKYMTAKLSTSSVGYSGEPAGIEYA